MKITYLKHSGFVVEYEDVVLIFDYYRGDLPTIERDKKVYVFASHKHYDHYQNRIFDWQDQYHHITYILSDDIKVKENPISVLYVQARQELTVDELRIQTFRSTDEGVAFLVSVKDKHVYHAGDLHWWHWEAEGAIFNEMMKRNFQSEIQRIKGMRIDVAFIPLDARQGEQYRWGMDYFMDHTDTKCVFPMHMWEDYSVCGKLMEENIAYRDRFQVIKRDGEVFERCM